MSSCGCGVPANCAPHLHKPGCVLAPATVNSPVYEGADQHSNLLHDWHEDLTTEDEALLYERRELVAKSRSLYRGSGLLCGALNSMADNIVGPHFRGKPNVNWEKMGISKAEGEELNHNIRCAMNSDMDSVYVDARECRTLTQFAAAAFVSWAASGEAMAKVEYLTGALNTHRPFATALRMIDPMRVFTPQNHKLRSNRNIYAGILRDSVGRNAAYYVHPYLEGQVPVVSIQAGTGQINKKYQRIAARKASGREMMIHVYDKRYDPEATRGRPLNAPILPNVKGQQMLRRSMLKHATVQSNLIATITSKYPDAMDAFGGADDYMKKALAWLDRTNLCIDESKVARLYPGEELDLLAPHTNFSSFDSFDTAYHAEQARCLGMGMAEYTGRYDRVNMSAARVENLRTWRYTQTRRADVVNESCNRFYACYLEEQLEKGLIPYPRSMQAQLSTANRRTRFWQRHKISLSRITWYGAGRDDVDQLKTAGAAKLWKEMGLVSDTELLAERGIDFDDHIDRLLEEAEKKCEYLDRLAELKQKEAAAGLTLDPNASYDSRNLISSLLSQEDDTTPAPTGNQPA
jgi:lambda family phage portal protein